MKTDSKPKTGHQTWLIPNRNSVHTGAKADVKELMALGLSQEAAERALVKTALSHDQQAAADERRAVEAANSKGLTGHQAEYFKARYVEQVQAVRMAVREHVQTVLSSPAAVGRPEAARDVALTPGLTTAQAIERLSRMPIEPESSGVDSTVRSILEV